MINTFIPYLIFAQICIGLFHAGIGLSMYPTIDPQYFFILSLALLTLGVYLRIRHTPVLDRSWEIIFEHAILIGILAWFFHTPW